MVVLKLDDRRQSFRYPVELQVDLVLSDGSILPVEACNISSNGLQFRCDSWLADEIEPRGIQNHPLDRIQLKVVTDLPISGENRVYARCRVIVARRLSQEEYLLGLEFIDFEKSSEKVLERFISECRKTDSHV
jgi:c-di-GMP-binding flagellar brake protein YcgR